MGSPPPAQASPGTDDRSLVERARGGDAAAFGQLVERHQGRLYRLALRVLRDEEQAKDVVQDAFIKVYGSLDKFHGRSAFYTWLYRVVFNLCLDARRRDRSDRHVEWTEERPPAGLEDPVPRSHAAIAELPGPEAELERAELRSQLARAIGELPDDARRTLELREVDGLSYAEIAKSLGVPKGTVMSRLHYARRRLRAALVEAGAVDPSGEGGPDRAKGVA